LRNLAPSKPGAGTTLSAPTKVCIPVDFAPDVLAQDGASQIREE